MKILYHWPLDPVSRQARIALEEKKIRFKPVIVNPWALDMEFLSYCAEERPPCLVETATDPKMIITGMRAIGEYCHEYSSQRPLLPNDLAGRAEARRICDWFDYKFANEVNAYILHERVEETLTQSGPPDPPTLREGRECLQQHLDYLEKLLTHRDWLAGSEFSLADIAAGAHMSCLDFLDEIPWQKGSRLKEWYQVFKSRPSVRPLLKDRVAGLKPPLHYANLDF